jgi:hypothetical protein
LATPDEGEKDMKFPDGDSHIAEPAWWRDRRAHVDWEAMVSSAARERANRDTIRADMTRDLIAGCHLLQKGDDWTRRDCEEFSQLLARLAEGVTYVRASVTRLIGSVQDGPRHILISTLEDDADGMLATVATTRP